MVSGSGSLQEGLKPSSHHAQNSESCCCSLLVDAATVNTADLSQQTQNGHGSALAAAATLSAEHEQQGSSIGAAIFNFTNCIVGAGAIGLGGAIASSGGFISIVSILSCALLTKLSLDMIIRMSVNYSQQTDSQASGESSSYEDLGRLVFGLPGLILVMISKFLYSFGCLIAYVIVVKDNLGPALMHLFSLKDQDSWSEEFLSQSSWVTWTASFALLLPLSLLRDMTPLAAGSLLSVLLMLCIVAIVIYLFLLSPPSHDDEHSSFFEHWIQIRSGFLESVGTFVFCFVSQHTVHLTFSSLKPNLRTVKNWKTISTYSISISTFVSLMIGVFAYMTFWQRTKSDIFAIYPAFVVVDLAKFFLCVTMLLTFPLPFFTCREIIIVLLSTMMRRSSERPRSNIALQYDTESGTSLRRDENNLEEPLLTAQERLPLDTEVQSVLQPNVGLSRRSGITIPGQDKQLKTVYHFALTGILWLIVTALAISAPSLGDVLGLVGSASGCMIAFIFPACLSFRLEGYSHVACLILVVGGLVGVVGTFFSVAKLHADLKA